MESSNPDEDAEADLMENHEGKVEDDIPASSPIEASSVSRFVYGICKMSRLNKRKRKTFKGGDKSRDQIASNSRTFGECTGTSKRETGESLFLNANSEQSALDSDKKVTYHYSGSSRELPEVSVQHCDSQSRANAYHDEEAAPRFHSIHDQDCSQSPHLQNEALDLSTCPSERADLLESGSSERSMEHISYIAEIKEEAEELGTTDEGNVAQVRPLKRSVLSITGLIRKRSTPMMKRYKMKNDHLTSDEIKQSTTEGSCTEESTRDANCLANQPEMRYGQMVESPTPTSETHEGKHPYDYDEDDSVGLTSANVEDNSSNILHVDKESGKTFPTITFQEDNHEIETNKRFKCKVCGKGFSRSQGLTAHKKIHSNERPFACPHCDQKFRVKHNLVTHVRTHTGEKPHTCDFCGRGFRQQSTLVRHLRSHTGERPYRCKYCDRTFTQRHVMMNHVRIHTGEKPYSCEMCGKGFKEQHNLVRHVRTHTGEKPYECAICGNKFTQKNHLMRHAKVHIPKKHTI